jgi:tricorn protease
MDALVVDERWNGGGLSPQPFIDVLSRQVRNYWATRDGHSWRTPWMAAPGPKVLLINEKAGSGGDSFPYLWRAAGLGPLIGTRTWGGLIGISGNAGLVDGAGFSVPTFGIYEPDGTWTIEGHGVDPDIEVVNDPTALARGEDKQLDKAIEYLLEELKTKAYTFTPKPPYPDRSGMGVKPEDQK